MILWPDVTDPVIAMQINAWINFKQCRVRPCRTIRYWIPLKCQILSSLPSVSVEASCLLSGLSFQLGAVRQAAPFALQFTWRSNSSLRWASANLYILADEKTSIDIHPVLIFNGRARSLFLIPFFKPVGQLGASHAEQSGGLTEIAIGFVDSGFKYQCLYRFEATGLV